MVDGTTIGSRALRSNLVMGTNSSYDQQTNSTTTAGGVINSTRAKITTADIQVTSRD